MNATAKFARVGFLIASVALGIALGTFIGLMISRPNTKIERLQRRVDRLECSARHGGYGQTSSVGPVTIRNHGKATGSTTPNVKECK